ncbi:MAG: MmgE/PrpD family protein [Deltaproteobacteria bacterium]|nr:MmgE/PrpD family protein [Deltaproteobacteria bacterium]
MADDIFKTLASHIVRTSYDNIPAIYLKTTKMNILDSIGTMIAGFCAAGCQPIVELVKEWGGKPESTVMMYGGKLPAHSAALANAVMARALDFDDAEENGMHPSAALMPVAFAVAESLGGVSGKAFLTAVTLGADVAGRINFATLDYHGFDPTLTCIIFGTTTVAGKLLGLNEEQMWSALGLAFNECSGTFQSNIDGVLSVRLNQGLAACEGIMCAQFAKRGITGVRNIEQGVYGYFHLYSNDKADRELLTKDLGDFYYGAKTIFKRWPSCGATLTASDIMVELVEEGLNPEDVEDISVTVGQFTYNLVGHPFKVGPNPPVDAQFSLQYTVANALLQKTPKLIHFTNEYILDDEVQNLIKKVNIILDPMISVAGKDYLKTTIDVNLTNGKKLSRTELVFKGYPDNPIFMDDVIMKYRDNISFPPKRLPSEKTERIIGLVNALESVENTNEFIPLIQF